MPNTIQPRELIRGNRDGAYGESATYTICRLFVPRERLVREIEEERLHPGYRVVHKRNARGEVLDAWPQNTPDGIAFTNINHGDWPGCCPAAKHLASAGADVPQKRLGNGGARVIEYIHGHRDGKKGRNERYTLCRLGVPEEIVAWEVREGLHPGFDAVHTGRRTEIRSKRGNQPEWRCGMACELSM
jgi:hypothetical protein